MAKKDEESAEPRIEVGVVCFLHPYDGPGIQGGVASSLTSSKLRKDSRHTIEYLPRLRAFEVTYYPRDEEFVEVDLVFASSVKRWRRMADCLAREK